MFKHGSKAAIWLGSADISPYFNDASFAVDIDTADTTTFGATWKTAIAGIGGGKVDFKGLYDPTFTTLWGLIADAGDILTFGPSGVSAVGDAVRLFNIETTSYAESSPVGGVVSTAWGAAISGTTGFGYVLHPIGVDTGTTTGADKDDTAATTNGWVAHLHVSAVSSGSWVVKLQDAATNDWADVTGGAFTAATGPTSQRLTGTGTLRRHVRYVATVTGGSTPTITFGLAVARS
jgi:hypothetical protein